MVRKYNAFKDIESCTDCCALKIKIQNLESKIKILREALEKLSQFGEGTHGSRKCSSWDCLKDMQIEMSERMDFAKDALEKTK